MKRYLTLHHMAGADITVAHLTYASAEEITDRALCWIDSLSSTEAFFATLNYLDAHVPYLPAAPFDQFFPDPLPGQEIQSLFYDRELAYLDFHLGRLFRAAQRAEEHFRPPGEALAAIAQHFIDTWKGHVRPLPKKRREIFARNDGLCEVPGCSRAAQHLHHIIYRSHGGESPPENLTPVCATHHLRCIHQGWIRVTGQAPHALVWELGLDADGALERHTTFPKP